MKNQNKAFLRVQGLSWIIVTLLLLAACPPGPYNAYVLDVTDINTKGVKWVKTLKGAHVWTPPGLAHKDFYNKVDVRIAELSACLQRVRVRSEPIEFDRVYVYVPKDWYDSKCSIEQLIPSRVNPKLCLAKKLPLDPKCHWKMRPTSECPCVCNVRAAIVDMHVVAATPNMKLFKAELARLVLAPKFNNPWQEPVSQCLK